MLSIRNLTKSYANGVQALRGITLDAPTGMLGLLGPNGAGKSTLMKILATLLDPDGGEAELSGLDIIANRPEARRLLGYLPQSFGLYPVLTAEQTLAYFAKLKGIADSVERRRTVDALLERVNLTSVRAQQVGGFSGGMRQRLGIAQALIGAPRLIIVDEPTAGLDPEERTRFHNLLGEVASDAVVILSTHIVADVAGVCSRVAIIDNGEIVASGTPDDAVSGIAGTIYEGVPARDDVALVEARSMVLSRMRVPDGVRFRVSTSDGPPGDAFRAVHATLEDYYLGIVTERRFAARSGV